MSNPVAGGAYQRNAELYIHLIAQANRDVELDDSPPNESDLPPTVLHSIAEGAELVHHAADLVSVAGEFGVFGTATAGAAATLGGGLAATAALGIRMGCEIVDANRDGELRAKSYQYDRMRGVLASLEGRADSPEVLAEAGRNVSFAAGLRQCENAPPALREKARVRIERCRDDGYEAVVRGLDSGSAFTRRYHDDLAFHHAVDYARSQRTANSQGWADIERAVTARAG